MNDIGFFSKFIFSYTLKLDAKVTIIISNKTGKMPNQWLVVISIVSWFCKKLTFFCDYQ